MPDTSAFGVVHTVAKAAGESEANAIARRILDNGGPKWKPIKPKKPTGPGSLRGKLDPETAHWPAAAERKAK